MTTIHKLTLVFGLMMFLATPSVVMAANTCKEALSGFSKKEKECTCYYAFGSNMGGTRWTDPEHGTKYIFPHGCDEYCEESILCESGRTSKSTSKKILDRLFSDDTDDELPPDDPIDVLPPADTDDELSPDDPANQFCQPPDADEAVGSINNPSDKIGLLDFLYPLLPVANAQIYSNYSVVTYTKGDVLILKAGTTQWAPVFKGQRMTIGDKLKTGKTGKCSLKFANSATLNLRPLSQLEIPDHKDGYDCRLRKNVGYLDMKFGKVWEKVINAGGDMVIKTPTGSTGIRDTSMGHLRGEAPSKYQPHPIFDFLFTSIAQAAGSEPIVHVRHDDVTNTSEFYVEQGQVYVHDADETTSMPLQAGEHIALGAGDVPQEENILPGQAIENPWWEEDKGLDTFQKVLGLILVVGIIYLLWKRSKKNK